MKFHEFGDKENPHIMLIHGGGNSWWNYLRQAKVLSKEYHVILPTLDGHGEEYNTEYVSTTDSAQKLILYINRNCNGQLFLLCGVSLGGQIVIEMLSLKADICQKAIIDGSICYPQPKLEKFCIATVKLFGGLMFSRFSCKCQMVLLRLSPNMRFPKEIEPEMKNIRKLKQIISDYVDGKLPSIKIVLLEDFANELENILANYETKKKFDVSDENDEYNQELEEEDSEI